MKTLIYILIICLSTANFSVAGLAYSQDVTSSDNDAAGNENSHTASHVASHTTIKQTSDTDCHHSAKEPIAPVANEKHDCCDDTKMTMLDDCCDNSCEYCLDHLSGGVMAIITASNFIEITSLYDRFKFKQQLPFPPTSSAIIPPIS